jgi:type II secretory pathway pseudopilin PulG
VRNRALGITLVDLLVSLAIITLCVAIAVPSLAGARKGAARVACLQQLKVIGSGLMLYGNANSGLLPPSVQRFGSKERLDLAANILFHRETNYDLPKMLSPYASRDSLNCPEPGYERYTAPRPESTTIHSNYIFPWGTGSRTPERGYKTYESAPPWAVTAADLTWAIYYKKQYIDFGNHLAAGYTSCRATPFILAPAGDPAGFQFRVPTMAAIFGLNAAAFDGSAKWVKQERSAWRVSGPFHQGEYRNAAVYLPSIRTGR